MTIQDITKLAQKGEGLHVEFKKKAAHPEKIVKEIIALANTEGGYLLLGVDDDGTVSGQRYIQGHKGVDSPSYEPRKRCNSHQSKERRCHL